MYSVDKGKGVRKKYIPSPCEVELPQSASLNVVLVAGRKKVFDDEEIPLSSLALVDSSGSRIDIEDEESWNVGDFYSKHEYKPSRYKLYVMYIPPVSLFPAMHIMVILIVMILLLYRVPPVKTSCLNAPHWNLTVQSNRRT